MQKIGSQQQTNHINARRARWTAFLLFAITASGLVSGGVWHYRVESQRVMSASHQALKAVNDLKCAQIEHWRQERVHDLRVLARVTQTSVSQENETFSPNESGSQVKSSISKDESQVVSGAVLVMCFDGQGNLISASPELKETDIGPLTKQAVATAIKEQIETASGFFLGSDRHCYLDIVCPYQPRIGPPVVWVARFDTRHFFRGLLGYYFKSSKSGESYLVRSCQNEVQLMTPLRFRPHRAPEFYLPMDHPKLTAAMAVRGVRGMVDGEDYRGTSVISAIREIRMTPWILITEVDSDEVSAGLREQACLTAGITLSLMGFAGLGISRLHRNRHQVLLGQLAIAEQDRCQADLIHQDILRTAMDGFCVIGSNGSICDANETYCHMTGYSLGELHQIRIGDMEARETPEETANHIKRIIEHGSDRFESVQKRKDGTLFAVEISVQHRPESGNFVCFLRDITVRKELEEKLQQALDQATLASRAKGEFLAVMSHELRTPLNSVLGFSELLSNTQLAAEQRELLANIRESGEHLLQHVSDILDFISMGNSGIPCETKPFSLSDMYGPELFKPYQASIRSKQQVLQLQISPDLPAWVIGDALRLKRILAHLIDNAVKFSDSGVIQFDARPAVDCGTDWIEFAVTDHGPGVSADQQQRIFEPFTLGDTRLDRSHDGLGMGLAISRKLASTIGGTIFLESHPGSGCTFRLVLPLPACEKPGGRFELASIPPLVPGKESTSRPSVLVAEDDLINYKLVAKFLNLLGYDCVHAKNGRLAVDLFGSGKFIAVLMDLQMPVMDGIQATRAIREIEVERTPIIALTANVLPEDRERCQAAGMDGFVAKPFKKEDLRQAFSSVGVEEIC